MSGQLGKRDEWDPIEKRGGPTSSTSRRNYEKHGTKKQHRVWLAVRQASPMMSPELLKLVGAMRARALTPPTISGWLAVARDIALFCLGLYTMKRVFGLAFTKGAQLLRLPD